MPQHVDGDAAGKVQEAAPVFRMKPHALASLHANVRARISGVQRGVRVGIGCHGDKVPEKVGLKLKDNGPLPFGDVF